MKKILLLLLLLVVACFAGGQLWFSWQTVNETPGQAYSKVLAQCLTRLEGEAATCQLCDDSPPWQRNLSIATQKVQAQLFGRLVVGYQVTEDLRSRFDEIKSQCAVHHASPELVDAIALRLMVDGDLAEIEPTHLRDLLEAKVRRQPDARIQHALGLLHWRNHASPGFTLEQAFKHLGEAGRLGSSEAYYDLSYLFSNDHTREQLRIASPLAMLRAYDALRRALEGGYAPAERRFGNVVRLLVEEGYIDRFLSRVDDASTIFPVCADIAYARSDESMPETCLTADFIVPYARTRRAWLRQFSARLRGYQNIEWTYSYAVQRGSAAAKVYLGLMEAQKGAQDQAERLLLEAYQALGGNPEARLAAAAVLDYLHRQRSDNYSGTSLVSLPASGAATQTAAVSLDVADSNRYIVCVNEYLQAIVEERVVEPRCRQMLDAHCAPPTSLYSESGERLPTASSDCQRYATIRKNTLTPEEKRMREVTSGVQFDKVVPPSVFPGMRFGEAIAVSGESFAVGTTGTAENPGAVFVFQRRNDTWEVTETLRSPEKPRAGFGSAVAMTDDMLAVASVDPNIFETRRAGEVSVFRRLGEKWRHAVTVKAPGETHLFGHRVAISGSDVVVAQPGAVPLRRNGRVHIYRLNGTNSYRHLQTLQPEVVEGWGASYGFALAANDGQVFFSAPYTASGEISVLKYDPAEERWMEKAVLSDPEGYRLGMELAAHDGVVAVSYGDPEASSGGAFIFDKKDGDWRLAFKALAEWSDLGRGVAITQNVILLGDPSDSWNGRDSGIVRAIVRGEGEWRQGGDFAPTDVGKHDYFGEPVVANSVWTIVGSGGGAVYVARTRDFVKQEAGRSAAADR